MNSDLTSDGDELAVKSPEMLDEALRQLCFETRHTLLVRAPRLDFPFFRTTELLESVTPLITGGRRNRFQILVDDAQHFMSSNARVIDLARKFSSYVKVRKLPPEYAESEEIYLLSDNQSFLYMNSANSFPARMGRNSPGRVRHLDNSFEKLWERSERISGLLPLGL